MDGRHEIAVLGNKNIALRSCIRAYRFVVSISQSGIFHIDCVTANVAEPRRQRGWKLRINKKLHSAAVTTGWFISCAA